MYRIIVSIALSDSGIDTIKSTPELPKKKWNMLIFGRAKVFWKVFIFL
jgi:hypothetical protein